MHFTQFLFPCNEMATGIKRCSCLIVHLSLHASSECNFSDTISGNLMKLYHNALPLVFCAFGCNRFHLKVMTFVLKLPAGHFAHSVTN